LLGFRRFGSGTAERYLSEINPGPFFAFCGIGNPDSFFADLARWHVNVTGSKAVADHHRYSRRELLDLQCSAKTAGAMGLVTTEKDAENLPAGSTDLPVWVAVIDFVFTAESELVAAIERKLSARRGVAA
jgi:tetraacyldisaccharide 4'-kinase